MSDSRNEKLNLDIGKAYSDIFPGCTLENELTFTNGIEIQTKMLEMFRNSLINKGFENNIADLMTVLYFNSTLGGNNGK